MYKVLYNCVELRIVPDADQLCMKAVAGRDKDIKDLRNLAKSLRAVGFSYSDFVTTMQLVYGPNAMTLVKKSSMSVLKRHLI